MYVYVHTYYQNLPYFTFWGMAVNRLVHDHAPSTCIPNRPQADCKISALWLLPAVLEKLDCKLLKARRYRIARLTFMRQLLYKSSIVDSSGGFTYENSVICNKLYCKLVSKMQRTCSILACKLNFA